MADTQPISTPALIIGAGPVGLFQAFQLGLLGIHCHIVDALPHIGGQCIELYPDKLIYDIPGLVACSGRELVQNLWKQASVFSPTFHGNQLISALHQEDDGYWLLSTESGMRFKAQTVFIAAGVGAFLPRTLHLPGLNTLHHPQIYYQYTDQSISANKRVVIFGDNDTAIECALRLCSAYDDGFEFKARSVTVVHRRETLSVKNELLTQFKNLVQAEKIRFLVGQITDYTSEENTIRSLTFTQPDDEIAQIPVDHLVVFWGLSPKLGVIHDWGLSMERKQLQVDTERFQTNAKRIFAVGDVVGYPGKKKLILCGFHEATLAAYAAASDIFPHKKMPLQYTTSIPPAQRALETQKNV